MIKQLPNLMIKNAKMCIMPAYNFTNQTNMRKVGKHFVPDLPAYKVNVEALRPHTVNEKQVSINEFHDMMGLYKKYRDIPQCRYFAFEYRNKIYHVFNAYFYPMGRMINQIATIIRGRNTPHYKNSQLNVKNGETCIIVNAVDPLFTGKKLLNKKLRYHTGFVGHLRTHTYRSVLNKKPQLLYYYLLRKAMPKTKLSEQYLKNLKIYRGPTHDIPNVPQFAPMRFIEHPLAQLDLQQYEQQARKNSEILFTADPNAKTGTIRGDRLESEVQQIQHTLDTDGEKFGAERKTKLVNKYTNKQMHAFVTRQQRIRRRYRTVRAPYKKKPQADPGYRMFYSEKEAKNTPYYEDMLDDDLNEDDDEIIEDPLKRKGFDK